MLTLRTLDDDFPIEKLTRFYAHLAVASLYYSRQTPRDLLIITANILRNLPNADLRVDML